MNHLSLASQRIPQLLWCDARLPLSIARVVSHARQFNRCSTGRDLESLSFHCLALTGKYLKMSVSPVQAAGSPLSPPRSEHNRHTPAADAVSTKSQSPTGTASSGGSKRKRDTELKLYAVRVGHKPGVYFSWSDCLAQVKGFKNATC